MRQRRFSHPPVGKGRKNKLGVRTKKMEKVRSYNVRVCDWACVSVRVSPGNKSSDLLERIRHVAPIRLGTRKLRPTRGERISTNSHQRLQYKSM